jgi:ATP-dependent DNA helicase RecG
MPPMRRAPPQPSPARLVGGRPEAARCASWACARHRPRAAPAAALRGRDAAGAHRRLRDGDTAQVQGVVRDCRVEPRRAASCWCAGDDEQRRAAAALPALLPLAPEDAGRGQRVRVRGEVRAGFFGREMVHPEFGVSRHAAAAGADAGLPHQRAAAAGLPAQGRGLGAGARAAARAAAARHRAAGLPPLREALQLLHHPPPGAAAGHAGRPQPPGLAAAEVRRAAGAAAVAAAGAARARAAARAGAAAAARAACASSCWPRCPCADRRAAARGGRDRADLARPAADAPPAAGRRGLGQDGGGGAGRGHRPSTPAGSAR